jgi:hypothetical protein
MGNCFGKAIVEKQTVYTPLAYKPYALSRVSEVSQETDIEPLEPPPLSI